MPTFSRVPEHVGFIPDGNRRWAVERGLPKRAGYDAGIEPGLRLLQQCRDFGVREISAYGFTKENVRRPSDQVDAFRDACVGLALGALDAGAGLLVVGDADSDVFPDELRPFVDARAPGSPKFNLLVNYGWEWDLRAGIEKARAQRRGQLMQALASSEVSRVDLVVRWGGRRRLSGFLPVQCAYADFCVIERLWPDMTADDLAGALAWYQEQDVTLGG